jgi:hypothetical protein
MQSLNETLEVLEFWAARVESSGRTALSAIIGSLFTNEELKALTVTQLAEILAPIEDDMRLEAASKEPSPDDDARRARLHNRVLSRILSDAAQRKDTEWGEPEREPESEPVEDSGILSSN